jgi:hypothetical protein
VDISGNALENSEEGAIVQETLAQQGFEGDEKEIDLRLRLLDWIRRDDGYLARDKNSK